ncbi:hypothetical protein [Alkalimonas amylolytica]|uniref:Transposase n=1 Tax=Alkalimonas amylolytica TaxID=152573 RepID=A0A1H3Z8W8_ALKAM|nr:hypothetical protein [Alkalimonas amylolytica]SEA20085.1 hypothetical protein SAMN04488051_10274 [Alkalimonas amylolytica]
MTTKKTRKVHTPEFKAEALKLAEKIGVAAAAKELQLYELKAISILTQLQTGKAIISQLHTLIMAWQLLVIMICIGSSTGLNSGC